MGKMLKLPISENLQLIEKYVNKNILLYSKIMRIVSLVKFNDLLESPRILVNYKHNIMRGREIF